MRIWFPTLIALALWAAGCAAPEEDEAAYDEEAGEEAPPRPTEALRKVEAGKAAKKAEAAPKASRTVQAGEWDELLRRLKDNYEVTEQQKASQADEHYRLAERHFQAGDFEKTELECEKALKINPSHAPANALFIEVQFILGRGRAMPASDEYDKYMKQAVVRHEQTILEIDNAYARGISAYNLGEYGEAEREFRRILEYAKWMPTGVEVETRR